MTTPILERILIVESDPITRDLVARQSLQPFGYQVKTVSLASDAILQFGQFNPQVMITNLKPPDLSAKDLLAVLQSQGMDIPVIVIAGKNDQADILHAFRMGATDFLTTPIREAEVINAVERAMKTVRGRAERDQLALKVQQANAELQQRVRELTTIIALGKAVTSVTTPQTLFKKIIEGSILVTDADLGWLLIRDERHNVLLLRGQHNMPENLDGRLNRPFDDGISSLVALSGEALTLHGEPIKRFKVHTAGQSIMVMPIKAQKQVIGLLVVMRKQAQPFTRSNQFLLEAVADYAAVSLVNASLFQAMEERAKKLQKQTEGGG
jgi:FixJ family two-component response regulator